MPLRGETIGAAYVRIIASGEGFPESVQKMFDDNEKVFKAQGRHDSQAYDDEFKKEMKNFGKGFDKALRDGMNRSTAIEDALTGPKWERLKKRIEVNYGGLGDIISNELAKSIRESQDISGDFINARLKKIGRDVLAAQKTLRKAVEDEARAEEASVARAAMERIRWDMKITRAHVAALAENARREAVFAKNRVQEDEVETRKWLQNLLLRGKELDVFGNKFGKAFGAHARNNALNIFGRGIQAIPETLARIPRLLKVVFDGFDKIKGEFSKLGDVFTQAGGGLSGVGAVGGSLAKSFAPLLASGAAVIAMLTLLASGIGILTSLLSGLVAGITAVAASISFALVGAIAPLVGLIPPLIFGIGTLVLAFSNLSKTLKKELSKEMKPVVAEFRDLQQIAQKNLFGNIKQDAAAIAPVIRELKPLVKGIARELRTSFLRFFQTLDSPDGRRFISAMTVFIPRAIGALGTIFDNTFIGLGGVFRSLIPITDKFLTVVEDVSAAFGRWANSATGQKTLKTFFDDAWASAKQLWGVLEAVAGIVATLFGGGKKTGDSILKELTDNLNAFNDSLKADGGKSLSAWFANGKATFDQLGNIIKEVGGLFQTLDTPNNRKFATSLLISIAEITKGLRLLIAPILGFQTVIEGMITFVVRAFGGLKYFFSLFVLESKKLFWTWAGHFIDAATAALGWIPGFKDDLHRAQNYVHDQLNKINGEIDALGRKKVTLTVLVKLKKELGSISFYAHQKDSGAITLATVSGSGGPTSGGAHLVGDKGPELWVPRANGMILPNNDPATQTFLRHQFPDSLNGQTGTSTNTAPQWDVTIITPTEDPRAVASEVMNRLAALAI